jgi:hypothetical protein
MWFIRDGWQQLKGECNADEWAGKLWQQPVVVAFPASQPVTLFGECHARDKS